MMAIIEEFDAKYLAKKKHSELVNAKYGCRKANKSLI